MLSAADEGGRFMRRRVFLATAIAGGMAMAGGAGVSAAQPSLTCNGLPATIVGTNGDDTLNGTPGSDVIVGLGGNDTIDGFGGADSICGGNGDDSINGDNFEDGFAGGADTIFGDNGNDFIAGLGGNDTIHGGNGGDIVIGGPGRDAVHGDRGNDFVFGNFGNDTLTGDQGDDFLNGDLPFPASGDQDVPPGAYEDPNPNTDSCDGGSGVDAETFCEVQSNIEQHLDPADVVIPQ